MKYRLLNIICCPACSGRLDLTTDENIKEEIINGVLLCNRCNNQYNIKEGIPDLTVSYVSGLAPASGYNIKDTDITYSLLWKDSEEKADFPDCHYEKMQEVIPENIITGKIGLEVGCGSGVDLWAMAKKCPDTEVVALDISEGVYAALSLIHI